MRLQPSKQLPHTIYYTEEMSGTELCRHPGGVTYLRCCSYILAALIVMRYHFPSSRPTRVIGAADGAGDVFALQQIPSIGLATVHSDLGSRFVPHRYTVFGHGVRLEEVVGPFTMRNGTCLLLSFPLVAETSYNRSDSVLVGHAPGSTKAESLCPVIPESQHKATLATMKSRLWYDGLALYFKRDP